MSKKYIHYLDHGTYPFDVIFAYKISITELKKVVLPLILETEGEFDEAFSEKMDVDGRAVMFKGCQTVIYLKDFKGTVDDYGTLAHECLHAVQFLFNKIGIDSSEGTEEAWAYQLQHIYIEILEFLKKKK